MKLDDLLLERMSRLCTVIGIIAIALGLASFGWVWAALDARNLGLLVAIAIYAWFWIGVIWVFCRARTTHGFFFGLSVVFLSVFFVPLPFPMTHVGSTPDYHAYYVVFMLSASAAFLAVGTLAWAMRRHPRTK
jgi:hypothetical protein